MRINPDIKKTLAAISEEAVKYSNMENKERKEIKRLLTIFKHKLNEEEQLLITHTLLDNLYYKNIVTDPDNVFTLHTIRARNVTYIFMLCIITLLFAAIVFRTNSYINNMTDALFNLFKFLTL